MIAGPEAQVGVEVRETKKQIAKAVPVTGHATIARDIFLKRRVHRKTMVGEIGKLFVLTQSRQNTDATIGHDEFEQRRPRLKCQNAGRGSSECS